MTEQESFIIKLVIENQLKTIEKLENQVKQLESQIHYWQVEAKCSEGRWENTLEDLEKLKKEIKKNK